MDAILTAVGGLLGKISDTTTIVLILAFAGSEWMRITETRENRRDRKELIEGALKEVTESMREANAGIQRISSDVKTMFAAATGKVL